MSFTPIALFAYKRPDHLRQVLTGLRANPEASETQLYVFSDGALGEEDRSKVESVRKLIGEIDGFAQVKLIARNANRGLAKSIIDGVGAVLEAHGRVIVVEDDLVVSPFFLRYMNEALDLYADDRQVASVHGYVYPVKGELPETFFLRGTDCWGWGTWARAWQLFEPDGAKLLAELRRRGLTRAFDLDAAYPYTKMLEDQIAGNNDSWAIRWHAAAFLADRLTLYPGRSLVQNIGNDASGTHSGMTETYSVTYSEGPIKVSRLPLEENAKARASFVRFGRARKNGLKTRLIRRIRTLMRF